MLFLFTDFSQKLTLEKINGTLIILFYVSPSSPLLQKICFFIKKLKIFQQKTSRNTPILVLRIMLGDFLKIPPLKKILEFQYLKKDYKTSTKKKNSNQKLNQ